MSAADRRVPTFEGLVPASEKSSFCKRMNRRTDTRHERLLRSALWRRGLRFRKHVKALPGKPDIVFHARHLVVFCDGDFWHGRRWRLLARKLKFGANASYWPAKIHTNILRDRHHNRELTRLGWCVIRLWETDILADADACAARVEAALRARG